MEEPPQRIERDPGPDEDQHDPESHRCSGLDALVPVGVIGVGLGAGEPRREQHQQVGDEIRQRMHAVGDQRLRLRGESASDLPGGQDQIDPCTDEGDPADDGVALGRRIAKLCDEYPPAACGLSRFGHRRRPVLHES